MLGRRIQALEPHVQIIYQLEAALHREWQQLSQQDIRRLKIKPNSVRIRFLSCQICVLPSTGFELTPLLHCSTNCLALSSSLDHIRYMQYNKYELYFYEV
jgi:hypothetical protein